MRPLPRPVAEISCRIGRMPSQRDLMRDLDYCRYYTDHYADQPPEWPPLMEVVDSCELPTELIERSHASNGAAICGIFPEIRRAWASVDNSLFLWRFDKRDGHCLEYDGVEEVICAVALAKSRPGFLVEHLLILSTTAELMLLGVRCSRSSDGTDPYAELSLEILPGYIIPSDGVTMTCISCTDRGHIFLAGCDGHIYELQYSTGSGGQKICHRVCRTAGLGSVISRWVVPNVFKLGVDPIIEMVIDNERHFLYTRTQEMKIQMFSLGQNGDGPLKKVAEGRNLIRQIAGSRTRSLDETTIISISPLSHSESNLIHLVAVLSDGRRMYLSTPASCGSYDRSYPWLNCLNVAITRPAPPLGPGSGVPLVASSLASRSQSEDLSLTIKSAYCSAGTLLLSYSSLPSLYPLLVVNRDFSFHHALREFVSYVRIEGTVLFVADVPPLPDTAAVARSLSLQLHCGGGNSCERTSDKFWTRGDLSTQHILPRRRIVIFSTRGTTEAVINRPVDILNWLLESNSPRLSLEDFFNRFGPGESAAMCLMLAAGIVHSETLVSNVATERAAEAYEDPRLVGVARLKDRGAAPRKYMQECPVFSGAYEGLCLCSSSLLLPLWELPIFIRRGSTASSSGYNVVCRLPGEAMQILKDKIQSLVKFLSRISQRRELHGFVAGRGDLSGSILIGASVDLGVRNRFRSHARKIESSEGGRDGRQQLSCSRAELAAMEAGAMERMRELLIRCCEALFLLQLLSQHDMTQLNFDANFKKDLLLVKFWKLVSFKEGDELATRLVSALMELYSGSDGTGTVADISGRVREGCPRYYKESDYKFFLAVECLERAKLDPDLRETFARTAFDHLNKLPEFADLQSVCKRFEDLRFYEAVVLLPLQKAQALDPTGNAFNEQIEAEIRDRAHAQRVQCYKIVASALHSLKGVASKRESGSPIRPVAQSTLNQDFPKKQIRQIVQLGLQSSDRGFHHFLYHTLITLGLEDELLEYGGPDLVPFLQNGGHKVTNEVHAVYAESKYLDLLARYYVLKKQHVLAIHVLVTLAERPSIDSKDAPNLEQRRECLSNAVTLAESGNDTPPELKLLLDGMLAVLEFQIKIKDEMQAMASRLEASTGTSESVTSPNASKPVHALREKAKELSMELKNTTQLYNDYASPFELWEICLEILYFANEDSNIVSETWGCLIGQALTRGGIAEACAVLNRVGSQVYRRYGAVFPLDTLCLFRLENAALERVVSGVESVRDEDIPRVLFTVCKGAVEAILSTYDQLLSSRDVLANKNLRLRLLSSVLTLLREWKLSVFGHGMGDRVHGRTVSLGQSTVVNQGVCDKIASAANRYMIELRRLSVPVIQTRAIYQGFQELEESLISPFPF